MVARHAEAQAYDVATRYPVIVLTGPRQSGKTTLCKQAFPAHRYVNLEDPQVRRHAMEDPRDLLASADRLILDEVQRVPELTSYIQVLVDADPRPGRFVLTGSQQLGARSTVQQSLAGRAAMLELLPLQRSELSRFGNAPTELWPTVFAGGYPRIHDRGHPPTEWFADYVRTYVERDVPQIIGVRDQLAFSTFLRLCAAHSGRLLNLSQLGADAGIAHNTAKAWLAVLEASYIVFRLPPLHANVRKRLVKTPKLHFWDTGLLCYLLGIRDPEMLRLHPLRGAIFESWVVSEVAKGLAHTRSHRDVAFYRDRKGLEVDLCMDRGGVAIECKSGTTYASDAPGPLHRFEAIVAADPLVRCERLVVVTGGAEKQRRGGVEVLPWFGVEELVAL